MKIIKVMKNILSDNDMTAGLNRDIFKKSKSVVLNIMSSPGAGKTSLILETIKRLSGKKIFVIEGDVAGDIDAKKIEKTQASVIQINTQNSCHLNASMINSSLNEFQDMNFDLILIENVGNLICPVEYDLGEDYRIVILSVPEGDDKPLKYPLIFKKADLLIISKNDMTGLTDFNFDNIKALMDKLNPGIKIISLSSKSQDGLDEWISWLSEKISK